MFGAKTQWPLFILCLTASAPIGADEQDVVAWLDSLGGRYSQNASGEIIGVDLRNAWVTDVDLQKLARLTQL